MKQLGPIDPKTFDGAQFGAIHSLVRGEFFAKEVQGEMFIFAPDSVPDDAQLVFVLPKTEPKKLAAAIIADNLNNDVEWAKLSTDQKLDRLRASLLKSAALQISGKADPAEIQKALVAEAEVASP